MKERLVVGIDIGGTKIAAAAIDAQGQILSRRVIPTEAERGFQDGVQRIVRLIEQVMADAHRRRADLDAIGIGCAGPVNPLTGTIDNPYTLPTWDGVNIVDALQRILNVPVGLENDADAAALGEYWLGAGQNASIVVMVTVGTGIGGGVILDGRVYRGVGGAHPEIGHLAITATGPECYCGLRGCWESLASGPAIAAAMRARAPERDPTSVTGASVLAEARRGDPTARAVVVRAAQVMARGVFTLINLYVPQVVVFGGGVMQAYDLFAPTIQEQIGRDTMAPVDRIELRKAALGTDAGLLGAARVALDRA
jgi:glucokinase